MNRDPYQQQTVITLDLNNEWRARFRRDRRSAEGVAAGGTEGVSQVQRDIEH